MSGDENTKTQARYDEKKSSGKTPVVGIHVRHGNIERHQNLENFRTEPWTFKSKVYKLPSRLSYTISMPNHSIERKIEIEKLLE